MFQSDEDFSTSLSALSIPQLQHVTQKLRIFCLRRKVDFIRAIVNDFRYERCNYIVIHLSFEIKKKKKKEPGTGALRRYDIIYTASNYSNVCTSRGKRQGSPADDGRAGTLVQQSQTAHSSKIRNTQDMTS